MTYKISSTGRLSVLGINSFPVSMFKDQWRALLDSKENLLRIIKENDDVLPDKEAVAVMLQRKRDERKAATAAARELKKIEKKKAKLLKMLQDLEPKDGGEDVR